MTRVVFCGLAIGLVLLWASPAAAHDGAVVTIHADGRGSVWITAEWADGHPVTEPLGALLTATSATGDRVGPAGLRKMGDAVGTLAYPGTLAPGEWTVVAELGAPAIGRCQAGLRVAAPDAAAVATEVRCAPPGSPPPASPPPGKPKLFHWYVGIAVAVFTFAGALLLYARRRANSLRRDTAPRAP